MIIEFFKLREELQSDLRRFAAELLVFGGQTFNMKDDVLWTRKNPEFLEPRWLYRGYSLQFVYQKRSKTQLKAYLKGLHIIDTSIFFTFGAFEGDDFILPHIPDGTFPKK